MIAISAHGTLSDNDLLARLEKSCGTERAAQRRIVCDLAEVERRRLYLPLGYGSLFEFCTDYLKYSRSSAGRRISAARCIARFPRMAGMFRRGECDLTVLAAIAGIVTKENCAEIAQWLRGRSLREVEAFAARRQPVRTIRDRVQQIFVMSTKSDAVPRTDTATRNGTAPAAVDAAHCTEPAPRNGASVPASYAGNAEPGGGAECTVHRTFTPSAGSESAQLVIKKSVKNRRVHPGSGDGSSGTTASVSAAPAERIVVDRKFKIQFAVDPEFMEKYKSVRSLLSTKYPNKINFEMIFDIIMTEYLERHSPESRMKKRQQRSENKKKIGRNKKPAEKHEPSDGKNGAGDTERCRQTDTRGIPKKRKSSPSDAGRTRHIPQAVRDRVFVRDGGQCTFVGKNGKRCNETRNLQIDHIIPYARGGSSSPENLRLLCFKHNQLEAEREYGTEHMKKYNRRE